MEKTISWIDDDIHILDPVVEQLETDGYKIYRFYSLTEAQDNIEVIKSTELLLLDLILPPLKDEGERPSNYPGKEFLIKLKEEYSLNIPVIIYSVVNRDVIMEQLKELKVDGIIHKPILPGALRERVLRVIRESKKDS